MASPEESALELTFPKLSSSGYQLTSPPTRNYNCVAWAAGRDSENWDFSQTTFGYWPRRLPRDGTIQTLAAVFATLGYRDRFNGDLESDDEKIAIYSVDGVRWTHVARQLESGKWSSKLGGLEDIEHASLEGIVCPDYGRPVRFLGRKRWKAPTDS